jgi:uncharacterized repeat protein (TIGR01451 family)
MPTAFIARRDRGVTLTSILLLGSVSLAALCMPGKAQAAGTRAGTLIENTASATYDVGATQVSVASNTDTVRVDELIDAVVDWTDAADVTTLPGATGQILAFSVTNSGNGAEVFALSTVSTVGGDDYDPTVTSIVIDDGDGVYEPGQDTVYVPGTNDPVLQPDASVTVFVLSTTPAGTGDGDRGGVQLIATSRTGTGAPGTSFAGQGEGGGDAVVGTTGGDGSDDGFYSVSAASVSLAKSAVVLNQFGGADAVPGATITYTIVATTTGSGSLANLAINDAIPAGTTYVAGSLRLGATSLTDAADADAGRFASNAVTVSLGTVPGGQTRTVTFQVTIN